MSKLVAVLILAVGTGCLWGLVAGQCAYPTDLPCHHCSADVDDGVSKVNGTLPLGSRLIWTCDSGYSMNGDGEMVVWVCRQNDTWLAPKPMCTEVSCSDPPVPAHGSIRGGRQQSYPRYGWDKAREECEMKKETLALSKDSNAHALLKSMISKHSYWIGARMGRNWKWASDNSYIQRLFWKEGEPNGHYGSCVELRESDESEFFWNDENCFKKNGFICKADGPCPGGDTDDHDSLDRTFNDSCYRFIGGNRTWHESKEACKSRSYGSLVEILDRRTHEFLSSTALLCKSIHSSKTSWWIGAFEDIGDSKISWFWMDNTRVITSQWVETESDVESELCVEMHKDTGFQWNGEPCSTHRGYFCQRGVVACGDPGAPAHGERAPDNTSSFFDGATVHFRCDPGYLLNSSAQITCLTNGSWDAARPFCQAVTCSGDPQTVNEANFTVSSKKFKGVATYSCSEGFLPTAAPVSYCQADATWSTPKFSCSVLTCSGDPQTVDGANFTVTSREFKGVAEYSCSNGFLSSTVAKSYCQADAIWSKPNFSCSDIHTLLSSTTPFILTTGSGHSRTFLSTVTVTAGAIAAVIVITVTLKIRNRQAIKSDTKKHLEGQVGYDHTSANIKNLTNDDVLCDLKDGETNHKSGSHVVEICSHGNLGDKKDSMIFDPLYSGIVEISSHDNFGDRPKEDSMVCNPLYSGTVDISSHDNFGDRDDTMVYNPLYVQWNC